ncbi:MAG: ABC transporter substrate-binding protein [Ilumatobacteraceae bacterium]|jgi:peptide/nickel transport system substrate-binding protein
MTRRPRRMHRGVVAVFLAAGLLGACGGNSPSTGTEPVSTEGSTAPTETTEAPVFTNPPTTTNPELVPVEGGSLIVSIDGDSPGFRPYADPWANGGHNVAKAVFDSLATYDSGGKVVPYLAEAITANDDASVWTITLRSGVSFHNGEPFNAEAVRQNLQASKDSPAFGSQLALLDSMTVVDDLTLELNMTQPWATFPNSLVGEVGSQIGYMAAPAMIADPDGGRAPIGTGPFSFVEWVPDDHLTVVRNDAYWQRPAYLDEVVFKPIPDSTSRKAAFDAGDTDVYYTGSSSEITDYLVMQENGELNVAIGAPSEPDMVMFNTLKPPFDDVRARRALAMAVDIPRLYEFLDATGVKQPLTGPYAASSFWFTESDYPEYDPEGAAALIAEYEAEVGPLVFDFNGNQDPFITSYQELFQSMWSEVGAEVNIVSKAQSENIASVIAGDYQVVLWGGVGGGDPDADYPDFHSGTGLNFSGFSTPEMDAALDAGRALTDPEARKEQYAIVQKVLGENVPFIWTGTNQFGVMSKPTVQGIGEFLLPDGSAGQAITGGRIFLKDVWLVQ